MQLLPTERGCGGQCDLGLPEDAQQRPGRQSWYTAAGMHSEQAPVLSSLCSAVSTMPVMRQAEPCLPNNQCLQSSQHAQQLICVAPLGPQHIFQQQAGQACSRSSSRLGPAV